VEADVCTVAQIFLGSHEIVTVDFAWLPMLDLFHFIEI
jgi:hypothetical protein